MIFLPLLFGCAEESKGTKIVERDESEELLETIEASGTSDQNGFLEVVIPLREGDSALMLSGFSSNYLALEEVLDSNGSLLMTWEDWYDSSYSLTDAIFADATNLAVQWPIRTEDGPLSGDTITIVLSTLNFGGQYMGGQDVELITQIKADPDFDQGNVRVAIAYAGNISENTEVVSAVEEAVAVWKTIWTASGLTLEERYSNINLPENLPYPDASEELLAATQNIGEDDDLLLIVGEMIANEQDLFGISGGIPGSLLNSERSAVMVSWLENAGTDGNFSGSDIQLMGETMAHEIGHYMGLYHPVESEYNYWDALSDTPDCNNWQSCENQMGDNLMFPYPICYGECINQVILSPEQQGVLQLYTGAL